MSKKIQVIIFLAIVAAIAVFALTLNKQKQKKVEPQKITETKTEILAEPKLTYTDPEKLPEKFPSDFPIEAKAEILSNYNFSDASKTQATRRFVSQKSLAANYKIYLDYLKNNSWQIIANVDLKDSKTITATKGTQTVGITIGYNAEKQVVVDISFVGAK